MKNVGLVAGTAVGAAVVGKLVADRQRNKEYERYQRRTHKFAYENSLYDQKEQPDDEPESLEYEEAEISDQQPSSLPFRPKAKKKGNLNDIYKQL